MKRLRLLALFVAVTTAPALTGTVHAGPVATEYPTDLGSSVDLSSPNDAASFRRDVGLRSDDGWVSRVAASADASLTWGVPLTPDESQELDRRFDIQQHQADVAKYLEDNPAFAGMWIDQKARGEVVISWTGDGTDTLASEVAKRLPASATVRFEAADFTARELEAARAQVESFWQSASGVTMGITSLGADVAANRTVIGIDPYSDALARVNRDSDPLFRCDISRLRLRSRARVAASARIRSKAGYRSISPSTPASTCIARRASWAG